MALAAPCTVTAYVGLGLKDPVAPRRAIAVGLTITVVSKHLQDLHSC